MQTASGWLFTKVWKCSASGTVAGLMFGATLAACMTDPVSPTPGTGGAAMIQGTGGTRGSGGSNASGGSGTGGAIAASGGATATGGSGTGGVASGGNAGGGGRGGTSNTGGASTGGTGTGGSATGGSATGGAGTGGSATGGSAIGGRGGRGGTSSAGGSSAGGAGVAGSGTGGSGAGGTTHTGAWKVMLLGDSVTGTCYPQVLSKDLIAGGHTNFQFVGTTTNNCGNGTPSVKTEAHGGYGVTYLPANSIRPKCTKQAQGCGSFAELQAWAGEKPDIVLMHFATNDCWDGQPTQTILAAYVAVIAEFRRQNPNVIFFVSKIIPLAPAPTNAINLNAAVTPAWAATNSTPTSTVHIIDHWTGFNDATDTGTDGVHPNAAGAQKMSTASYNALVAAGYF
jgi:lysophospholipase L1-like esterase